VLLMDVDGFKAINDEYGHEIGNQILAELAVRLYSCVRACDTVGRYGGDEFIAMLPETSVEHAHAIANRLCQQLSCIKIKCSTKNKAEITGSIGVAGLDAAYDRLSDLLKHADQALYAAKAAGRNQAKVWSPPQT